MQKQKKQQLLRWTWAAPWLSGRFRRSQVQEPHWESLPKLLSLRETARILQVHVNTLRIWDQRGILPSVRIGSRQDRRYNTVVVRQRWRASHASPREQLVQSWLSQRSLLTDWRRRGVRPVGATLLAFVLLWGLSALQPVKADTPSSPNSSLSPSSCTGWAHPDRARSLDFDHYASLAAVANTSATYVSANYQLTTASSRTTSRIDLPSDTLTCSGFFDSLPSQAAIHSMMVRVGLYTIAPDTSSAVFRVAYSVDGFAWTEIKTVAALPDHPDIISFALPELSAEQRKQFQVRISPEVNPGESTVTAALDGVEVETAFTVPIDETNPVVKSTKRKLDPLVQFSQAAYQPDEQPVVRIPKQQLRKLLYFFTIGRTDWKLDQVTMQDAAESDFTPQYTTQDVLDHGSTMTQLNLQTAYLHPGKYTVRIQMSNDAGGAAIIERTFFWGVVAFNYVRPSPSVGEQETVALGILDDGGRTICDADVTARITDPRGRATTYSTAKGSIIRSTVCVDRGVTNTPDYALSFTPDRAGTYTITITAKTKFGERKIQDNLIVHQTLGFDVQRSDYPTRIYPPSPYPVTISITPHEDFQGVVSELVPGDFSISKVIPLGTVAKNDTQQRIEWLVDWKAGTTYQLHYTFKSPDISPALFLTGPVSIATNSLQGNSYTEPRQWQIASDAIAVGSGYVPSSGTLATGNASAILAATAAAGSGVNTGSYLGTLADDNYHWTVAGTNTAAATNIDMQLNVDGVQLNGANKIIVQTEIDTDAAIAALVQICDWDDANNAGNFDSPEDSNCNDGSVNSSGAGWRTLNSQSVANADISISTITAGAPFSWNIRDGYFTTGATGGTALSTPLANFVKSGTNQVKIRYYSATQTSTSIDVDYLRVMPMVDSIYEAAGFTQITGGTPSGTYVNTNVFTNTSSAMNNFTTSDAVYLSVPGTAGAISDFYLSYKNVQTYTGANTIYVRADYSCSTTGINIKPKIYNFNSSSWQDLTTGTIACSATDANGTWAMNNVTISNYISNGEIRIGWYGSANNTLSIRLDFQYIMIGTTNSDSAQCEITFGTGTATNCTNTRDIDLTGTTSNFSNPAEDESNTFGKDYYPLDNDGDATVEEAAASNMNFSVTPPSGSMVIDTHYAGRFDAGSPNTTTALTVQMGLRDYTGIPTSTSGNGGWTLVGASDAAQASGNTYTLTDSVTAWTAALYGNMNNAEDRVDTVNNLMNVRLQTTASGTTTNNVTVVWDFAMVSIAWINTTEHPSTRYQFVPTGGNTVTAGAAPARLAATANTVQGVNTAQGTAGWKATLADDNYHWSVPGAGATGVNFYLDLDGVQMNGANKMIIQTEFDLDTTLPSPMIQICDWDDPNSAGNFDSAEDTQCNDGVVDGTGAGWRSLNSVNASNAEIIFSNATPAGFLQWQIYDGYWSTGTSGGTSLSTPLSNFINTGSSNKIRIRWYATTNHTSNTDVDYLRVMPIVDSMYEPAGFTKITGGTPVGTYASTRIVGNTASAQQSTATTNAAGDAVYLSVPGTAGAISDFYFSFKNIKLYNGMNTIYIRSEYSCSTTGINIKPKIYNFKTGAWVDLTSATIACSATDAMGTWAVNNVTITDYIQNGELRVGWYGSGNNTLSIRVDDIFVILGSTNSDTAQCAITFGTGTATDCTNTRNIDLNNTVSSFAITAEDETNTMGHAFIAQDNDGDANLEEANAANIGMTVGLPSNAFPVGGHFAGRFAAGYPNTGAGNVNQLGLRNYAGVPTSTAGVGGWDAVGATATAGAAAPDSYTHTDSLSVLAANVYGTLNNPLMNLDTANNLMDLRLRTTTGGASGNNVVAQWDFAFASVMWTETSGITVSGNVYSDETPTFMNCTTPKTVRLMINGAGNYSGSCTGASGSYTISNVPIPYAGATITVYLDGATEKGSITTESADGTSNITNLHLYQDVVAIGNQGAGATSNDDLRMYDSGGDSDIQYTVAGSASGSSLTVSSGDELHVVTGTSYTAGGPVTTNATGGNFHVLGTATIDTGTNTIGSDITIPSGGTLRINADTTVSGGDITVTSTGALTTTAGTPTLTMPATGTVGGTGNITVYNLATSGSGTTTWNGSGTNTINNNISVAAGTTLKINASTSVTGIVTNTSTGVLTTDAGTPTLTVAGTGNFCGGSGGASACRFYNLTFSGSGTKTFASDFEVLNNLTLSANISAGSTTVTMSGASGTLVGGGSTINSLTINGTNSTITLSSSNVTVGGTLTVGGDAASNTDELSISSGRELWAVGTTNIVDTTDTVSGLGKIVFMNSSAGPGTTGNLTAITKFDAVGGDVPSTMFDARTYSGPVELSSSSGFARTIYTATGAYIFSSTLLVDSTGSGLTLDMNTTDPTSFTVAGAFTIGSTATVQATSSGAFTINGNYTNNGTFTDNSGTVTLAGGAQQVLAGTMTGSSDFNNLVITNASGSDPDTSPSVIFSGVDAAVAGTFTATTANTKIRFDAGNTYTFQNMTLNGQATGTRVYLRSSSSGSAWLLNVAGTATVSYTNVKDSNATGSASPIDASDGTNVDGTGNTNWNFVSGITVSGFIYTDDAATAFNCNTNGSRTVAVKVNGSGSRTGTCTQNTGAFSITNVTVAAAGDVLTVFISGATEKAVTVTLAADNSSSISALPLRINRLVVTHESAGPMTNSATTGLGRFDKDDDATNLFFTANSNNLSVDAGKKLIVNAGKTFTPGGTVTTAAASTAGNVDGDVEIPATATLSLGTNTLSVGGDLTNAGTVSLSSGQTTTMTATGTGFTLTSGGTTMQNLTFNGSGGGWTNSGALTVAGTWTGTAGGFTQVNSTTITVNGTSFSLANGFTWTKASSGANLILDHATNLSFADNNTTKQNLGVLQIGASPGTTTLTTDLSADTVTIPTGDTFNTKGYDVTTTGAFACNGTCTLNLTDTAPSNEGDGTILDVGGDFTMSTSATFTSYSNSKAFLNSTSGNRTFSTGGKTYNDVELKNTDGTNDDITIANSPFDVNGTLTLTDGQLRLDTNDPNVTTAGNVSIASAATVTKADNGTATWTFDGSGTNTWTDSTGSGGQDLGLVSINGSTKTVNLGSDAKATTMTVAASQTFGLGSSGYTFTLTGSGTGASEPFQNSGTLNEGTNSTFKFTGISNTDIEPETFWNLTFAPPSGTATYYNDPGETANPVTVSGALVVGDGSHTVTLNMGSFSSWTVAGDVTVNASGTLITNTDANDYFGGSFTNNGTYTDNANVYFNATSTGKTISGNLTGGNSMNLLFDGVGGGWTITSNVDCVAFYLANGSVTQGANIAMTNTGSWQMLSGTTFTKASGTGAITFIGTTATLYTDSTASKQNIGDVVITKTNGTPSNNQLTLASSMTVDTMTISASNTLDIANSGYTLEIANTGSTSTPLTVTGTLTTNSSSTVKYTATNSGGNISIPSLTFASLDVSPGSAETYDVATGFTISDGLTVGASGTFAVASGQTVTLSKTSGTSLTNGGTVSGAGRLTYQNATAFPAAGAITSILRMDATNAASQAVTCAGGGRTLGGAVEFYSNAAGAKTITICQSAAHSLTISGAVTSQAANSGGLTLEANTYDPTIAISGNLTAGTSGGGTETLSMGGGTWTLSGDADFSNTTVSNTTGGTLVMDGTGGKTLTGNGQTFNNLTFSPSGTNTIYLATSNVVTGGAVTVGANTTLDSSVIMNMNTSSCSISLNASATYTGTGTVWYDCSDNTFPTTGTFSLANLWLISYFGDMTIPARNYAGTGIFRLYNNSGVTRTFTLGAGTFTLAAQFNVYSASGSNTVVTGSTNNPNITSSADFAVTVSGAETRTITTGSGNWSFGSHVNLTNTSTFTASSGNTITMTGASKTLTTAGFSLYNFTQSGGSTTMSGTTTLDGTLTNSGGTITAPATLNVAGNWSNSGTFVEGTGTVTLNGAASTTLDTGCATPLTTCTNQNFYNLTVNKTDASDANDNVTLTSNGVEVSNTLTITDGELIQGALDVRVGGATAVSIASAGKWTNISTGDLKLGGTFTNAGTATFASANSAQCTDVADDIAITSTSGGSQRLWSGAGTFVLRNVNATDMTDSSITVYTSTLSNTTWTVGSCGITVSGRIYTDDGTTPLNCSTPRTVAIKVNGAGSYSAACSNTPSTGSFSVSSVTIGSAGDVVSIYVSGASEKANTVTLATDTTSAITADLYQDRLIVRHESAGPITNNATTGLGRYDKDDDATNFFYTANANALSLDSGKKLLIWSGKTFTPGGTVTTAAASTAGNPDGDLSIQSGATLSMGTNALSIGGDYTNSGTFSKTNPQTTSFTATGSGFTVTTGSGDLNATTFSGNASGNGSWTISGNDVTIDGALTVDTGDTLAIDSGRIVSNTSSTNVNNDGTISGSGTLRFTDGSAGPDTDANSTGTYSSVTRFDATNGDVAATTFDARTYSGTVQLYSNSTSSRSITMSGTYTLSGSGSHFTPMAMNTGNLTIDGSTNNPTVTVGGDLDFTGTGDGTELLAAGTGTWTVSGNVDFTDGIYGPTIYDTPLTYDETARRDRAIDGLCAVVTTYTCEDVSSTESYQWTDTSDCVGGGTPGNELRDHAGNTFDPTGISNSATILTAQFSATLGAASTNAPFIGRSSSNDLNGVSCNTSTMWSALNQTTYGQTSGWTSIGTKFHNLGTTGVADVQSRITGTTKLTIGVVVSSLDTSAGTYTKPAHLYVGYVDGGAPTLTMNGTSKTLTTAGNGLYNVNISGTITLANETQYIGGDLNLTGGDVTPGSSTVYLTGAGKTLTAPVAGDTLNNLTIDPSSAGTITLAAGGGNLTVGSLMTVASSDTLSLGSGRTLTLSSASGSSLSLSGTVSGAGRLTYMTSTAFPTTGTISSMVRFDATNASSQTISSRTYGGAVEIYNNSGGAKTVASNSGTMAFSSTLDLSVGSGSVTLDLNTTDPTTTTVSGALTIGTGATLSAPSTNPFSINGNYTNSGTFTDNSGTVTLAGSSQQTLSGTMIGSSDFNNLTVTNASGSDPDTSPSVIFASAAATTGTFTASTANTKLRFAAGSTYTMVNVALNGQATGTRIYLRSSSNGSQWNLTSTGTQSVSNTDVRDSYACGGDTVDAFDGTNNDATNNSCWNINTISLAISDTTIGFGSCTSGAARYATSDAVGASSDSADAHTLTVATNARSGYSLSVAGATLSSSAGTISAIGGTAVASNPGNEQFGLRAIKNSGSGSVASPFNGANWAFTPSSVQSLASYAGSSSSYSAVYGVRYICNVSAVTEASSYSTDLTYVVTSTF